jgi:hypothetical protein
MAEANRLWMIVGVELFSVIGARYDVIEVYPYAAFRRLGASHDLKRDVVGRGARLTALAGFMCWDQVGELSTSIYGAAYGPMHDKIDAMVSAALAWRSHDHDAYCDPVMPDRIDMIAMPPRP